MMDDDDDDDDDIQTEVFSCEVNHILRGIQFYTFQKCDFKIN